MDTPDSAITSHSTETTHVKDFDNVQIFIKSDNRALKMDYCSI